MSTPKWSDNDLDAFFRRSAEESDPAYDPAAWQDLKARLNKHDRTRWLNWLMPALLLLLLTGSVVWHNRRSSQVLTPVPTGGASSVAATTESGRSPQSERTRRSKSVTENSPGPSANSPTRPGEFRPVAGQDKSVSRPQIDAEAEKKGFGSPIVERLATGPVPTDKFTSPPVDKPKPARTDNRPMVTPSAGQGTRVREPYTDRVRNGIPAEQADAKQKQARRVSLATQTDQRSLALQRLTPLHDKARQDAKTGGLGRHRSRASGLINETYPSAKSVPVENRSTDSVSAASDRLVTTPSGQPTDTERSISQVLAVGPIKPAKWSTLLSLLPEPVTETVQSPRQRSARPRLYGLSVQAVLSPDLSTIGLRNFDRPGSNVGVLVQYQLSERFSVQTGALWSTKLYKSTLSEYTSPVYMHVLPESITGKCTMFDIPLNIRYDVLLRPGGPMSGPRRWFVSGGATSYFIDREIYDYKFMNPNDPAITARGWDSRAAGRKGGSFGLSNLNFSVGYERPVSRRLSWQVEPFMKVPLQPIGYFKVKLISTGAFVALRYHL